VGGAWVVVGDRFASVASHAEALAGDRELARLGLDPLLADFRLAVVERQNPGRDAGRVLTVLDEVGGQDQVGADRHVFTADDLLLEVADPGVDIVQAVVLDVERVPAKSRAVGEQDPSAYGAGISTSAPIP